VSSQPQAHRLGSPNLPAGEGQVFRVARRAFAEQPAGGAHVRKKADAGLGHGQAAVFGHHHQVGAGGQAQAAPHGDAVGQDHHRLGKLVQFQVQGVFCVKELVVPGGLAGLQPLHQHLEVAPGAKAPLAGAGEHHQPHRRRLAGSFQAAAEQTHHFQVQAVENPGPVEDQGQEAGPRLYYDGCCVCCHRFKMESGFDFRCQVSDSGLRVLAEFKILGNRGVAL
jgi:hypothetical protein